MALRSPLVQNLIVKTTCTQRRRRRRVKQLPVARRRLQPVSSGRVVVLVVELVLVVLEPIVLVDDVEDVKLQDLHVWRHFSATSSS